jgi:hypothetical protein
MQTCSTLIFSLINIIYSAVFITLSFCLGYCFPLSVVYISIEGVSMLISLICYFSVFCSALSDKNYFKNLVKEHKLKPTWKTLFFNMMLLFTMLYCTVTFNYTVLTYFKLISILLLPYSFWVNIKIGEYSE